MPNRSVHRKFDEELRKRKIITKIPLEDTVHRVLDGYGGYKHRITDPCHDSEMINFMLSEDVIPDLSDEDKVNMVIMSKGHELLDETSSYEGHENFVELFDTTIEKMKI